LVDCGCSPATIVASARTLGKRFAQASATTSAAHDGGSEKSATAAREDDMNTNGGTRPLLARRLWPRRAFARWFGALGIIVAASGAVSAQEAWPSRPIKLVVPLTAGGGVDMMARLTAQHLSDQLGQQVVVENQGGAGGTIAASTVARARPDGYTLIFQSVSSAVVNALVYKNLPYDPIKDLIPVTLAGSFPLVLVTNPDLPAKDLGELIALLKANPGKYSYGSSGVGTMPHLAGELFKSMAGVDIVHVPYRGNSAIMADLFAGRVAIMFDGPPTQLGNIQGGKVRALAITTAERSPVLPAVPPVADTLPGYAIPFWTAIFAPANTPKDVVERIAAETGKAMQNPDVIRRYGDVGIVGIGSSPQELDRFWREQLNYLGKIVKGANVKPVE
jgi:tripartite-type tricarboxylate transporter receptor subunit TctC